MRQQSVLIGLLCWLGSSTWAWANTLDNIRVLPAAGETRLVMDLATEPTYSYFVLAKPDRLVIDLHNTDINMPLPLGLYGDPIIRKVRTSTPIKAGSSRLVVELKEAASARVVKLLPLNGNGHGVMIDLQHKKESFAAAKQSTDNWQTVSEKTTQPPPPPAPQPKLQSVATKKQETYQDQSARNAKPVLTVASLTRDLPQESEPRVERPFGTSDIVIAIDPGHGGNDPGAVGQRGKYEKYVTLAIAKEIANKLNAINGVRAVLTRTGDYYVGLNQRSAIARKQGAHLLISVHADGYHQPQPHGASVWLLSRTRANNEIGRWIERHEEQSELLGGGALLEQNNDAYLSRAVLDLQFSNSQKEAYDVAVEVLKELSDVTTLHKPSPEHASLAVLKSPDIPSLLVEAGFITNPAEEILLITKSHQQNIANAVYKGVLRYFEQAPPDGTLLAAIKNGVSHKVKSGESLSIIAQKYGTSVLAIKTINKLESNVIRIGQVLKIPNIDIKSLAANKNSPDQACSWLMECS